MNNTIPMYIAVQLESEYGLHTQRRWLQLPATRKQFEAVQKAIGAHNGDFIIKQYTARVPGFYFRMFMESSLGQVNHYASRAAKMTDVTIFFH